MHRATPANSSFRAFSAGGARALLQKVGQALPVDDSKLMQEISASFMKGEARGKIEHSQQYGFTSLPFDPDEGKDGKPGLGPETFISFMGGNRSFPVAGAVDDRRHRLKGLEKGDVALFSGKDSGQQLHLNGIGTFLSSFPGKKIALQIVKKAAEGAGGGASTFAEGDSGGQAGGDEQKPTGQKPVYKNEAVGSFELNDDGIAATHKQHSFKLPDDTAVIVKDGKVYLGGDPDKGHKFGLVGTSAGPSINVYARVAD
jgi:Bacteriophage Mu Gp45 spike protein